MQPSKEEQVHRSLRAVGAILSGRPDRRSVGSCGDNRVFDQQSGSSVKSPLVKIAISLACTLLCANPARAQLLPPAKPAATVKMVKAPALEMALDYMAIVRWTTTNPGGDDEHFAIAHYGMNPEDLSQIAKSHIRLNRSHPDTIFRVRLLGLKPNTTYYYWVSSMGADGKEDGARSAVCKFTTPLAGNRIINFPQPK